MTAQPEDPTSVPDVPFIDATDVADQPNEDADQSPYAEGEGDPE